MSMQNGGVGLSGKGMGLTGIGPKSGKTYLSRIQICIFLWDAFILNQKNIFFLPWTTPANPVHSFWGATLLFAFFFKFERRQISPKICNSHWDNLDGWMALQERKILFLILGWTVPLIWMCTWLSTCVIESLTPRHRSQSASSLRATWLHYLNVWARSHFSLQLPADCCTVRQRRGFDCFILSPVMEVWSLSSHVWILVFKLLCDSIWRKVS